MADEPIQPQGGSTPNPSPEGFKMPEKFAGKSAEDIAKSYLELERSYGERSSKLQELESYSKIGPADQVAQAIEWARGINAKIAAGELVPASQRKEAAKIASQAENTHPWDSEEWAYKSPAEQSAAIAAYTQGEVKKYVDQIASQYGQQIQGLAGRDSKEKSILVKALKTAIRNPTIDPEELLNEAAQLAGKSAEELIDMVMDARSNSPESMQKKIDDAVAVKMAEARQKWEADQLSDLTKQVGPAKPRIRALGKSEGREAENRSILENLAKQGIRLT